jgi:hypothetical protein
LSASVGFSVTALARDDAEAERLLRDLVAACPALSFYDRLRGEPILVENGQFRAAISAPPHAGERIGSYPRELFWLLEHAEISLPGWEHEDLELEIGGELRPIRQLEELAEVVDEHFEDEDFVAETEPETLEFLRELRRHITTALSERLPVVVYW